MNFERIRLASRQCDEVAEGRSRGILRHLARAASVLTLLSCSDPLEVPVIAPPAGSTGPVMELSAQLAAYRRDSTGEAQYRIVVRALDRAGRMVPGAELSYRTLVWTDSVICPALFGPDGSATLTWLTRDTLAPLHLLELNSGESGVLRIAGRPGGAVDQGEPLPTSPVPVDTVGAQVSGGIAVRVLDSAGFPVRHQTIYLRVVEGGGAVGQPSLVTDSGGNARTQWRFGSIAGLQSVKITVPWLGGGRLVDLRSGNSAPQGSALTIGGIALPGAPHQLVLGVEKVESDAIGARIRIPALGHDVYGNLIAQPRFTLDSPDTNVARKHPDGSLRTAGAGVAKVYVTAGQAKDSLYLVVNQKPVAVTLKAGLGVLSKLGGRTAVKADAIDRLGAPVPSATPNVRNLTPTVVGMIGADSIVALQQGVGLIEASLGGIVDTLSVAVVQVPARILVPRSADTLAIDQTSVVVAEVYDSGGTLISDPQLMVSTGDASVIGIRAPATLNALLPGEATVTVQSGPAIVGYRVTVEGVALLVDGMRASGASALTGARSLELTNGRIRLRWHPAMSERGGFEMDTRIGDTWYPANMRGAGDWLYVTSTVLTEPTSIVVLEDTPARFGIAMRFGGHRFDPVLEKFPAHYQNEPFPFTRTLWLSPRQYGYFSWTELERVMQWEGTELEVGFGGLFGPASITSGHEQLRTDSMTEHVLLDANPVPDAASFDLDGDLLMRILVPLPEAPMISPVFPGWGYGSVYVHRMDYQSYGAYLYAAPRIAATTGRQLCAEAWSTAPFALRSLTAEELAGCGAS